LALPAGLLLTTRRGRRWRDLAEHYSALIGPERMKREDVRPRLRGLVWLTLRIEAAQDDDACGRPINAQLLLHMQQEFRAALTELDLDYEEQPEVRTRDYIIFEKWVVPAGRTRTALRLVPGVGVLQILAFPMFPRIQVLCDLYHVGVPEQIIS
jgi:hypothetical protein